MDMEVFLEPADFNLLMKHQILSTMNLKKILVIQLESSGIYARNRAKAHSENQKNR